jgi:hypothetical protein
MDVDGFQIPDSRTSPAERANYCRNRVAVKKADAEHDQDAKFELLNFAERWLTLAFHYRRQTN